MKIEIKKVKLSDIRMNPDNPRTISEKAMERLVKSLKEFPDMLNLREIVVDETMTVLGGNMRLLALQKIGTKDCTAKIVTGLTDDQKREFIIKDNSAFGEWDLDALANAWSDLPLADWGIDLPDEWLNTKTEDNRDSEPQIDRAEELNKTWNVKPGDLWLIGEHRLLCGDSTKKEDVGRVMGGKKADLVFTDPPYGVGKDIANDDLCGKEFDNFNAGWIAALPAKKNCGMVCYHSTRTFPSALNEAVKAGWSFERMLWYYRPDKFPTHSWNHWMMVSQAIMLFSVGAVDYADTESDQDCYRLTSSDLGDGHGHPTEKMAEHCQRVMQHFKASIVYDPFLGSGTTMVACQNLNRKCYGVEISPGYCAVILERMITAFPEIDIRRAE